MLTILNVLGVLAALVLLVVLGLYLAGRRGNGAIHESAVDIEAPAERLWPWLVEPARIQQWVGGLKVIESLTPDLGIEAGARDRMLIEVGGQQQELFSEVTRVEIGKLIEQRLWQAGALAWHETARFTIQPMSAGRSRFVVTASYTYTTLAGTILEPLIRIAAAKKLKEDLASLKSLVEAMPG